MVYNTYLLLCYIIGYNIIDRVSYHNQVYFLTAMLYLKPKSHPELVHKLEIFYSLSLKQ